MNNELLANGLAELGLTLPSDAVSRLGRYVDAIESWNPAYGLVGASGDELIIKHILDSLAPVTAIRYLVAETVAADKRPGLVDLGTGAGLPGIPVSIACPSFDVTLLDRMTRRIRFLEAMKADLPLNNAEIVEQQAEHARGSYDIVTFRAFRPFERKLFKRVFALCADCGFVVAYKGRAEKAQAELVELEGLYASVEVLPVKVPFLVDERCIVVMRPARRASTPC